MQQVKSDKLLGNFIQCYVGYTTNEDLRYKCGSGGIITQTFLYLLERKAIDGALVSRMGAALKAETFIARTPEEIISARGSVYYPVPFFSGVKQLLEASGKFAVVGLPCHLKLLRERYPELQEKIVLSISLFCNHTPSAAATETFLDGYGIKKEDVKSLKYRGLGWPGTIVVETDNKHIEAPYADVWCSILTQDKFYTENCRNCHLCMPEEADICCGDAWIARYLITDKLGTSLVVCKTQRGYDVLERMRNENFLALEKIDSEEVIQSQPDMLRKCKK